MVPRFVIGACLSMSTRYGVESALLHGKALSYKQRLLRLYYAASSAVMLEDHEFDESRSPYYANAMVNFGRNNRRLSIPQIKRGLLPIVVSMIKTSNWEAILGKDKIFWKAVMMYGFPRSITAFKIIIHLSVSAGMRTEVYALLKDIVAFYEKAEFDTFSLFSTLSNSPQHVEQSVVVYDMLIRAFASYSMLDNSFDVFMRLKQSGFEPDILSCNFLLNCLVEKNRAELVGKLFEELKISGPSPNIHTYAIMMGFYCRGDCGQDVDINQANGILKEIFRSGEIPPAVTYRNYICGLCKLGSVADAVQFIYELWYRNQPLNTCCFNPVIREYCRRGAVHEALQVLQEMRSLGVLPDVWSYTMLIHAFCKKGDIVKGFDLIEEMKLYNLEPSIISCTSLVYGLCKSKPMEYSMSSFQNVGDFGCKYDQAANEFCRGGDMDSAKKLMGEMITNDLAPTSFGFQSIIGGLHKQGLLSKALEAFNSMPQYGVLPNTITSNFIIDGLCREGHFMEALTLLEDFQDRGIELNSRSYDAMICWLCKGGHLKRAWELLPRMMKRNVLPGVVIYNTLIDTFSKQSNLKKAFRLYESMLKVGVSPNTITYTVLFNIFSCVGKMREASFVFHNEMKEDGLNPDHISFTSLIDDFCRTDDMRRAWKVYKEVLTKDLSPVVFTKTCLIHDMVSRLIDEMNTKEVTLGVVTYSFLIYWCLKHGYEDKAHRLYREMRANGISPDDITRTLLSLRDGVKAKVA